MRLFVEEQRLADQRLDHLRIEGLRHQEGRLRLVARQQPFGESGDEDHRHGRLRQDVVDRVDAGTPVGELDIRENHLGDVCR